MAGIYIHIPFCKQRCNYCDFYKTTQVLKKQDFLNALIKELINRKKELHQENINTIYFGGGTPSLLEANEINRIINIIFENFKTNAKLEITLESNPDDLTKQYINHLKKTPINRLSIGIQSFNNHFLSLMNRRHNSQQAVDCVKMAQDAGFNNISTDLIYGLPGLTVLQWEKELIQMQKLNIQHLSAYHLTYESGTSFGTMLKKGTLTPVKEETSVKQFEQLIDWAKSADFEHYEISNFAREGFYSKHNRSYWQQKMYLGAGPAAHSYNKNTRSWNVADLNKYINGILNNQKYFESEELSVTDKYNEYLMTGLRTKWGVNLKQVEKLFGREILESLSGDIVPFIDRKDMKIENENIILTDKGIFVSDAILTELIKVQE